MDRMALVVAKIRRFFISISMKCSDLLHKEENIAVLHAAIGMKA